MSQDTGFNQTLAQTTLNNFITDDLDVRFLTTAADYDDAASNLDTKEVSASSYSAQTVATADWTVSSDTTAHETTLTNDNSISFGTAQEDWGTVVHVVLHRAATNEFIIVDEPNDPNITSGEEVTIDAGAIEYTVGGA